MMINICLLTQWVILGDCIMNKYENQFLYDNYDELTNVEKTKSEFINIFESSIGENTHSYFSAIPLVISFYCFFKILYICKNK
jgi:hypothetical protein